MKSVRWLKRALVLCALLAGAAYGGRAWYENQPLNTELKFQTAPVTRGDVTRVVSASGQLNPVVRVDLGSQISGNIQKLFADFNSIIKEGQLLAQIDPATYEANLLQAKGNLAQAQAGLKLAKINEERAQALRVSSINAKAEYDIAVAELAKAQAAVEISEAAVCKAQVDLARCKIYAPIDGIVISRNVNVGQTVAASLSAPTLFVIANDLSKMQIEADVAEADIGVVVDNQETEFTVDAFPGRTFRGKVSQIRNLPKADQSVVTYVTVIDVTNPELKLKPGMTANVSIVVNRRDNVVKLPDAALRFRPPKNVEAKNPDASKTDLAAGADEKPKKSKGSQVKKDKRPGERKIYVLKEGVLQTASIRIGITDGRETEVLEGLNEGDTVVVDVSEPKEDKSILARLMTGFKD